MPNQKTEKRKRSDYKYLLWSPGKWSALQELMFLGAAAEDIALFIGMGCRTVRLAIRDVMNTGGPHVTCYFRCPTCGSENAEFPCRTCETQEFVCRSANWPCRVPMVGFNFVADFHSGLSDFRSLEQAEAAQRNYEQIRDEKWQWERSSTERTPPPMGEDGKKLRRVEPVPAWLTYRSPVLNRNSPTQMSLHEDDHDESNWGFGNTTD